MKKMILWAMSLIISLSVFTFTIPNARAALQVVDKTSLLAYWNLDEGTGNISKEQTGVLAGRNLSVKGTSKWVTGKNGKAFYFDGSTVLAMDGAKAIKTDNLTVVLWAKIDDFPTSDTGANLLVVNSDLSALDKGAFDFGFFGKGLYAYVVNNFSGGTGDRVNHGVDISSQIKGKWQHFAVVYNQDEGQEYAKLFLNGNEIKSSKLTSILGLQIKLGYPKTASYKKCDLNFGGYTDTAGKVIRAIKGAMDDIAVYGRALSISEIKLLAAGVRPDQTASSSSSSVAVSSKVSSSQGNLSSKVSSVVNSKSSSLNESISNSESASSLNNSDVSEILSASVSISESEQQSTASQISNNSDTSSEPDKSNNSIVPLIIILLLAVVAVGGIIIYLIRRKK